jgi:hypothetical protein
MTKITFEARIMNLHAADLAGEFDADGEIIEDVRMTTVMHFPGTEKDARRLLQEMDGIRYPSDRGRGTFHIERIVSVEP